MSMICQVGKLYYCATNNIDMNATIALHKLIIFCKLQLNYTVAGFCIHYNIVISFMLHVPDSKSSIDVSVLSWS